jgi:hypothetical protein
MRALPTVLSRLRFPAAAATILAAVAAPRAAEAADIKWTVPKVEAGPAHILGTGYDMRAREFRDVCVTGDVEEINLASGRLDFESSLDVFQHRQLFEGAFGAGVDLFLVSAHAEIRLSQLNTEDTFSRRVFYNHQVKDRFYRLISPHLTPRGEQAVASRDPEFVRLVCGDRIVGAVNTGGTLSISARFDFSEETQRREFDATVKARFLFFTKTWKFEDISESARRSSKVTIDGYQIGGDPSAFDRTLASARTRACPLATADECLASVNQLIAYAQSPTGFAGQVGDTAYRGPNTPVMSYSMMSYSDIGLASMFDGPTELERLATQDAIERLATALGRTQNTLQRATALLAGHLRPDMRADLELLKRDAQANVYAIGNTLDGCFTRPADCPVAADHTIAVLAPLDPARLERPVTTYDYCLVGSPDDADRVTVDALAAAVGVDVQTRSDATCTRLEAALDAAPVLDLRGRSLTSARPFRGVRGLRTAILRDNRLENAGALASIPTLEELDLTNNRLASIGPLTSSPSLKRLLATGNMLTSIDGIDALAQLELVTLERNRIADASVVTRMPGLRYFARNADERCTLERRRAVDLGLATATEAARYNNRNWAPIYSTYGFTPGPILSWASCVSAVTLY